MCCTGLTSVTLGNSVTSIGNYAFQSCNAITSAVTIPNSVITIGNHAFEGIGSTSITIGHSVKTIGDGAFAGCIGITSITIPNSVTSIGESAFSSCDFLYSVTMGNSVTNIGKRAFANCIGLGKVIVNDIAAWCGIIFNDEYSNPLHYGEHLYCDEDTEIIDLVIPNSVTNIGNYAFNFCTDITTITIPNTVTCIGDYAFKACFELTSITIPNSVTAIGNNAFQSCFGLTSLTIPNSVTTIGEKAFENCTDLTEITIPNSVTAIGEKAFDYCRRLTSVISKLDTPFSIDSQCFHQDAFSNATLYVPQGAIDKYMSTNYWNKFVFILEENSSLEMCAKPTIGYSNGRLTFNSATEGATCYYSITDTDIKDGSGEEVYLTVTYNVSVYASKVGYNNSETATATLCWIDTTPTTEGITDDVTQIPANAVLIQAYDGFISVSGVGNGHQIVIYQVDGKQVATAKAYNGSANVATNIRKGTAVIVKIDDKAVKVMMK